MINGRLVLVYSGGLDSTALLWYYALGFDLGVETIYPIMFDYGQRNEIELEHGQKQIRLVRQLTEERETGIRVCLPRVHCIKDVCITENSSLIGRKHPMPQRDLDTVLNQTSPPDATFVPGRNLLFATLAGQYAVILKAGRLALGFIKSAYPDSSPTAVSVIQRALEVCLDIPIAVRAPFIGNTKEEVLRSLLHHGAVFSHSYSCYEGTPLPCGKCDPCIVRAAAWEAVGEKDHFLKEHLR